jgi:outer membrane protein OmpA-like peptidoglycan-associated protein
MSKNKKESFFWTSYSDLMTSLFFVMLVLFVLVIVLLHNKMKDNIRLIDEQEKELIEKRKMDEITKSTQNIDATYFDYNTEYKKLVLKIKANFDKNKSEEKDLDINTKKSLIEAGKVIQARIDNIIRNNSDLNIQFLIVIEGQASKDNASDRHNYELSYKRAYTLKNIWENNNINFGEECEVLISGSGTGGSMRERIESKNQRFLIHIIPKIGEIKN